MDTYGSVTITKHANFQPKPFHSVGHSITITEPIKPGETAEDACLRVAAVVDAVLDANMQESVQAGWPEEWVKR